MSLGKVLGIVKKYVSLNARRNLGPRTRSCVNTDDRVVSGRHALRKRRSKMLAMGMVLSSGQQLYSSPKSRADTHREVSLLEDKDYMTNYEAFLVP